MTDGRKLPAGTSGAKHLKIQIFNDTCHEQSRKYPEESFLNGDGKLSTLHKLFEFLLQGVKVHDMRDFVPAKSNESLIIKWCRISLNHDVRLKVRLPFNLQKGEEHKRITVHYHFLFSL